MRKIIYVALSVKEELTKSQTKEKLVDFIFENFMSGINSQVRPVKIMSDSDFQYPEDPREKPILRLDKYLSEELVEDELETLHKDSVGRIKENKESLNQKIRSARLDDLKKLYYFYKEDSESDIKDLEVLTKRGKVEFVGVILNKYKSWAKKNLEGFYHEIYEASIFGTGFWVARLDLEKNVKIEEITNVIKNSNYSYQIINI